MNDLMPFIVVGLASGAVYGLAGVGLVLTYRTSGVFNFAHGAVASAGAYAFFELHDQHGLAWPLAVVLVVGVFGPAMGFVLELLGRRLAEVGPAVRVVATVGLLLAISGLATIIYGPESRGLPQFLPTGTFRVFDVNVGYDQVILVAVGLALTVFLSGMLRKTRTGLAMRAVVDDPALLELTGLEAPTVRRRAWMIGSSLAAGSGLLLAPLIGLDPLLLTLLVVQAFGAAAIGRFRSLGLTFAGGLGVGVLAAVSQKYVADYPALGGFPSSLPFIILFAVLLASRPGTLFDVAEVRRRAQTPMSPLPPRWRNGFLALGAVAVVLLPSVVGVRIQVFISAAAYVVVFLSLGLLVKTSGQVSLCHAAFVATGAATFSHLRVDAGLPWLVALFGAGLLAVPVGAFVAIPAIRLSGVYLALATFGFGVLLERMVYRTFLLFGSEGTRLAPRPDLGFVHGQSERVYFYLAVAFAVAAAVAVRRLQRARLGRLLEAVSDSPKALTSLGASVTTALVLVFCASAFLAGVAGALLASGSRTAGPSGLGAFQSLLWLSVIAIAGSRVLSSSVIAAVLLAVVPIYLPAGWADYQPVAFGLAALAVALVSGRVDWVARMSQELAGSDRRRRTPVRDRRLDPGFDRAMVRRTVTRNGVIPGPVQAEVMSLSTLATTSLRVENLRVAFGGLVAVDDLTLEAPVGRITGLIGPNGAGKSTTFDSCSGFNRPSGGRISFAGHDLTAERAVRRAHVGIGRTFQRIELFDSLDVRTNVAMGREARLAGRSPLTQLWARRQEQADVARATDEALSLCGLGDIADVRAGSLSTGQRRLVELARALSGGHRLLLLDEPSSGLDPRESKEFGRLLRLAVETSGTGILVVEHDMSLIAAVCDYVYVLDFGKLIFEGTASEVLSSDTVRIAYLGTEPIPEVDE